MYHLPRELFEAHLAGDISPRELSRFLAEHLITLCPLCEAELRAVQRSLDNQDHGQRGEPKPSPEDWHQARKWMEELQRDPISIWAGKVARARKRFRGPAFAELMLEQARLYPENALETTTCAQMALPRQGFASTRIDAMACALQMNAYRVQGSYDRAQQYLDLLPALLNGVTNPACQAEAASLIGSLLIDLRHFSKAKQHLSYAAILSKHILRDSELSARTAIKISGIHYYQRQWDQALNALLPAFQDVQEEETPRIYFILRYNLAMLFCAMNHPDAALELLPEVQAGLRQHGTTIDQRSLQWLEGRIHGGLSDHHRAYRLLTDLRDQYLQEGQHFCAAIVACDICCLHLDRNELDAAVEILQPALSTMCRHSLHEESEQVVRGLQNALLRGVLTLTTLKAALPHLEQAARVVR